MFKRRRKRSYAEIVAEGIYPRGGWSRAASYVLHRIRRLPDPPHKISRGIAAGAFISFTPFFGLHFLLAAMLAWVMRGNILAAVLATFLGNPITFPIFAQIAVEGGLWILGQEGHMPLHRIVGSFSTASVELWSNFAAIFTAEVAEWGQLHRFFHRVFLPYLVGGIVPGIILGIAAYVLSRPVITAYQKGRIKRLKKRYEKRVAAAQELAEKRRIEGD
ncbi:MAG: DUF2062 domain-containing protein [Rhodobacteraceae bacterium]|nr:DUF2062 domain-containing protein [Paracoccaceae bacterium]